MNFADFGRTHRERKEMYIKALEQEVLRLKEIFSTAARERDTVADENRRLKELLAAHGIRYDFTATPIKFQREESGATVSGSGYGPSSSGSISGSYAPGSDSTRFSPTPAIPRQQMTPNGLPLHQPHMQSMAQLPSTRLDYDQIGIDFVLTYDSQGRPMQVPAPYPSPPLQR